MTVAIFGEGGGKLLADELDVPLLAKVPLSSELREHADEGTPLVIEDPDAPASQMIREAEQALALAGGAEPLRSSIEIDLASYLLAREDGADRERVVALLTSAADDAEPRTRAAAIVRRRISWCPTCTPSKFPSVRTARASRGSPGAGCRRTSIAPSRTAASI